MNNESEMGKNRKLVSRIAVGQLASWVGRSVGRSVGRLRRAESGVRPKAFTANCKLKVAH